MKLINYKFWFIRRDDDGFITETAIRFYEGEMQNLQIEDSLTKKLNTINIFVRTARLDKKAVKDLGTKVKKELSGEDTIVYDTEDFGRISTDDELRNFLDNLVKKDKRSQIK